jgi:hypothetical protein
VLEVVVMVDCEKHPTGNNVVENRPEQEFAAQIVVVDNYCSG